MVLVGDVGKGVLRIPGGPGGIIESGGCNGGIARDTYPPPLVEGERGAKAGGIEENRWGGLDAGRGRRFAALVAEDILQRVVGGAGWLGEELRGATHGYEGYSQDRSTQGPSPNFVCSPL